VALQGEAAVVERWKSDDSPEAQNAWRDDRALLAKRDTSALRRTICWGL